MPTDTLTFDTIAVAVDGQRGTLRLDRPDKLNPLSTHTLHEIELAARWFDEHLDLKVVVVSGAGRAFSSGADLSSFTSGRRPEDREQGWRMGRALDEMRAVTVARLHGWCVGGGVVVAAGCDLRIAAASRSLLDPRGRPGHPLRVGRHPAPGARARTGAHQGAGHDLPPVRRRRGPPRRLRQPRGTRRRARRRGRGIGRPAGRRSRSWRCSRPRPT